jgi:alkylation response protein AidB-like acyl-CoA dehydrogenase
LVDRLDLPGRLVSLVLTMDDSLYFTEQHHQVREMVREFSRDHIASVASELDRTSTFPWENIKAMGELGLLGVPWGEELGGAGMDQLSYYITIHEMAKVDASHALTISAHTNLGTSPIVEFGTEEQKRRYVPLLASGQVLGGFGLTEPGAGSDAGGTAATAVDKGDHYLLNGSKIFITHAGVGEIFNVTARTEPGKGNKGITSFIVTKDTVDLDTCRKLGIGHAPDLPKTKGVRAGKKQDKMGWRASDTRELIFEDAVVPKENLLGKPGYGFINFLKTLDAGRIGIAALSLGIAEGAYEEALRYAGVRKQFGRPIGSFQAVSFQLADMAMEIEAGTHLLYHAAWLKQNGRPFKKEAAMAKLYCSELAMRTTTKAVQIFGGYGYTTEYPVERMMRDAKVCEIGEGTSEIQRIVIGRQILGELVD